MARARGACPECGDTDWKFNREEDCWYCRSCGMQAPESDADVIAKAMSDALISPNEWDSNGEEANLVDGLFAIARALDRVARAIEGKKAAA